MTILATFRARWKPRLLQLVVSIDQVLNCTICFGKSEPWADETVSSRAWRLSAVSRRWAALRVCIDGFFRLFGEREHCHESYMAEWERRQCPPEMRTARLPKAEA